MIFRFSITATIFMATTLDAMHYGSVGFGGKPSKEFEEAIADAEREKLVRQELLEKIQQMESTRKLMEQKEASLDDIKLALGENFTFVATYNSTITTIWNALRTHDTSDGFIGKMFQKQLRALLTLPEENKQAVFVDDPGAGSLNVATINSRNKIKPRRELHDTARLLKQMENSILHDLIPGGKLGMVENITIWHDEKTLYFEANSASGVDREGNAVMLYDIHEEREINF